jgi:hypothetical protein
MNIGWNLANVLLVGLISGAFGQGIRLVLGWLKASNGFKVDTKTVLTLVIGAIAGLLAAIVFPWGDLLESGELLGYVAAGYAGADFVEGVLNRYVPKFNEVRPDDTR